MNKSFKKIGSFSVFILFFLFYSILSFGQKLTDDPKLSVVVIDPGHGGKDPGAVVANAREKDIALDISLKLGNLIRQNFTDVKVLYTRKSDVFIPLNERARLANKNDAGLFISIHANYAASATVNGAETFTLGLHRSQENLEVAKKENSVILLEDDYEKTYEGFNPSEAESYIMFENIQEAYSEQSIAFASEIQDQFRIRANRNDRSVKQAGFIVLREAAMPSVLVEVGFISNELERKYLLTDQGRTEIASSLFQSFKNHKKKTENRSSFQIVENTSEPIADAVKESPVVSEAVKTVPAENNNTDINSEIEKINTKNENNVFFAFQIGAFSKPIEITSSNFKGEKDIFMVKVGKFYKYYCGKSLTLHGAKVLRTRIAGKFSGAFLVKYDNGNIIPVK